MEKYLDKNLTPQERAEDLLSKLSLEEKVRQISCTSVMNFPLEMQDLKNGTGSAIIGMQKHERLIDDIVEVQNYIMENSPHHIPALFHTEALAGSMSLFGGSQYPISIGLAATFDPERVEEMASFTSKQVAASGVRHANSPVCDLARDLRWGRCNETYGGDPTLSSAMTVAYVKGLQGDDIKKGVGACCKHFLAYSVTEGGLNSHQVVAPMIQLREQYAKPFEAAINLADVKMIMNCYASIEGRPATANKKILTDLLRDDLGFGGLVVSDYGSVAEISTKFKLAKDNVGAANLALKAGLDVELPGRDIYSSIVEGVNRGEIDEKLVDRSALRMLKLKFELGLFENPYGIGDFDEAMDNSKANIGSYKATQESITLLKNDGILPLKGNEKIAVIGPTANSLRLMYSHYTATSASEMLKLIMAKMSMTGAMPSEMVGDLDIATIFNNGGANQKKDEMKVDQNGVPTGFSIASKYFFDDEIRKAYPDAKTIYEGIKTYCDNASFSEGCDYKGDDESGIEEAVYLAKNSDIVILCVGEKSGLEPTCSSGEGMDSASFDLPGVQEKLIRKVFEANKNVILVHTACRPLCSEWVHNNIPAVIEGWFPSTYGGEAISDVIFGKYNPSGRLPVDMPRSVGHSPCYHMQYNGSSSDDHEGMDGTGYIDSPSTSLLPFGYGLSYTKFEYDNMSLVSDDLGNISISVDVRNVGDIDGEEVVQLYGKDLFASMVRPRQELIGFKRVALNKGESKTVRFDFNIDILSFVGEDGEWLVESGEFEFFVGSNSKDISQKCTYELLNSHKVDPNKRTFYAFASINK